MKRLYYTDSTVNISDSVDNTKSTRFRFPTEAKKITGIRAALVSGTAPTATTVAIKNTKGKYLITPVSIDVMTANDSVSPDTKFLSLDIDNDGGEFTAETSWTGTSGAFEYDFVFRYDEE